VELVVVVLGPVSRERADRLNDEDLVETSSVSCAMAETGKTARTRLTEII
jgi:hypothetical protein